MLEKVKDWCRKYELLNKNDKIIVACSGGPDSLTLLSVLLKIRAEFNLELIVAHFNHMLRGIESDEDECFVKNYSKINNLKFCSMSVDIEEYCKSNKLSLEEGARIARYRFLRDVAAKYQTTKIAVGHNKDDQAETVLINLLRGAGSSGIAGISAKSCDIIRPLLSITRIEIEEYCKNEGLEPRIDKSNLEPCYLRNKIRLNLIPQLKKYNPAVVDALWKTADLLGAENDYINFETEKIWLSAINKQDEHYILDKNSFKLLHKAIKRTLIRKIIDEKQGNVKGISFDHIEKIIDYIENGQVGGKLELPNKLLVENKYNEVIFITNDEKDNSTKLPVSCELSINSINSFKDFPFDIKVEVFDKYIKPKANQAIFDFSKIEIPLILRTRNDGDTFKPKGMKGSKKLKKFFIDCKIDQEKRDFIPLVCNGINEILWVVGYRQSSIADIDNDTAKYLLLTKIQGV